MSAYVPPVPNLTTDLVGIGGAHLRGEGWLPAAEPSAVVVISHGKDEHIGRYRHVVGALTEAGYAVYLHDHRGHGTSDGARGDIVRFDDFIDDLDLLVEFARARHPRLPVFLLGHSMGGLVAVRYTLRFQEKLNGLILSGAALRLGDDVPWWKKQLLLLAGRFTASKTLPPSEEGILSRDPSVEAAFRADSLCHNELTTLGFVRALYLAANATRKHAAQLRLPLLVMHGQADKLTSPLGSKALYDQAVSEDKTLKIWPDDRHEIFNELDKDDVIAFTINWLRSRSGSQPSSF